MNIMIDLETLDTSPSSVILSIGMVAYNDRKIVDQFYAVPSMQEQITLGRTISASTLQWWMAQSSLAKKVFEEQKNITARNLTSVLLEAAAFIKKYPDAKVWSYGANFDVPIVQHALEMLGHRVPWKYANVRCFRTWCDDHKNPYKSNLATHNTLQDAIDQAQHMIGHEMFAGYGSDASVVIDTTRALTVKDIEDSLSRAKAEGMTSYSTPLLMAEDFSAEAVLAEMEKDHEKLVRRWGAEEYERRKTELEELILNKRSGAV